MEKKERKTGQGRRGLDTVGKRILVLTLAILMTFQFCTPTLSGVSFAEELTPEDVAELAAQSDDLAEAEATEGEQETEEVQEEVTETDTPVVEEQPEDAAEGGEIPSDDTAAAKAASAAEAPVKAESLQAEEVKTEEPAVVVAPPKGATDTTWTVTFHNRDGEIIEEYTREVDKGTAIGELPETIAREDYDAYWAVGTSSEGPQGTVWTPVERVDEDYIVTKDLDIIPDYDKITYTVKFFTDDTLTEQVGNDYSVNVDTSYCLNNMPQVPAKNGYAGKWVYSGGDFTNSVSVKDNAGENKTLNVWAEYDKKVFTVTYNAGTANDPYLTDTFYFGDSLTLPAGPVIEGKEFTFWYKGEVNDANKLTMNGDGYAVDVNGNVVKVTTDLTITAGYTNMHAVTFVVDRGEGQEQEVLHQYFRNANEPIGTLPQDPFVAGKVFEKWVIQGTDTEVTADTIVTGDMTVEAVFRTLTVYEIEVHYYYDSTTTPGKKVNFETESLQAEEHELPYTITAPASTQTDPTEVSGAPIYYPETPTVTVSEDMFDAEHKCIVEIKYVPYTAQYDFVYKLLKLGGDPENTADYEEIDRQSNVHGVLNSYVTPTVKTFDYAVLKLAEGATITTSGLDGQPKQELPVYYTRKNFQLTYETNGGSYVGGTTVPYGTQQAVTSTVPTRNGYTFAGWYLDEGLTQAAGNTVTINGNTTLYAKWTGRTVNYTIVYMLEKYNDDGTEASYVYQYSGTETAAVGTTVNASDAPAISSTQYKYWEPNDEMNANSSVEVLADGSSVLKVYYQLKTYTFRFNAGNYNNYTVNATLVGKNVSGTGLLNYTMTVKLGQDISSSWPSNVTGKYYYDYYNVGFNGWLNTAPDPDVRYVTMRALVTADMLPNTGTEITYTAQWSNDTSDYTVNYWLQNADDDEYTRSTEYSQTYSSSTGNLQPKDIAGYKKHNGDASSPGGSYAESYIAATATRNYNGNYVRDDNMSAGSGYVYYSCDGHLYRLKRNQGDYGKDTFILSGITFNFYYDREAYTIDYYYGSTKLNTISNVKFDANINKTPYVWTPTAAQCGVDSDSTFAGWYADSGLTTPYTFTTMPASNLVLYAKWTPKTFTVNFVDGDDTSSQLFDSQTVEKYKRATNPGTPTKAGYNFDGWYSSASGNQLYDWNTQITENTTVYAHWTRNTLSYTVHYVDEDGNKVAADKEVSNPNFAIGQSVTEKAIAVVGYRPNTNTETITLAAENNVITFVYSAKSDTTTYTVKYILDPAEYPGEEIAVATQKTATKNGDAASVVELAASVDYATLYEAHPELSGVEFYPDEVEKTLVLTSNASQNVITFYYSSYKHATVTVNFVDMDGNAIADPDVQKLKVGKDFTLSREAFNGWEPYKAVEGTAFNDPAAGMFYKITEDVTTDGLTFTIFYQKKATITVVSETKQYDGTALTLPANLNDQVIVEGLKEGHSLNSVSYTYANADSDNPKGRLNAGIATVVPGNADINGNTSTNGVPYYKIRYIAGTLEVTKINVTIRIEPDRWVNAPYTGEPYMAGFTNGNKAKTDYVMISDDGYADEYLDTIWNTLMTKATDGSEEGAAGFGYYGRKETNVGDYDYDIVMTLGDLPEDPNYSVSLYVRQGRLQIVPVELTVTTGSGNKTYDGTPLTNDEATLTGLVAADEGKVTVTATGTITNPGSEENSYTIDWGGVNPDNYIIKEDLGTLVVTEANLSVTVKGATETYDGSTQYGNTISTVTGTGSTIDNDQYTVTGLANGDVLTVTYTPASGKDAGTYNNGAFATNENGTYVYTITNAEGKDVTASYNVPTFTAGNLVIDPRPVTIASGDATKVYDGTALTNDDVEDKNANGLVTETGWVDGEGAAYSFTGSQTNVGSSSNTFTYTLNEGTNANNYTITKTEGTLTVTDETIDPVLVVTKNDDKADDYRYKEGETATFTVTVKNVYAEAKTITLSEIEGVTLAQSVFTNVPAGETRTTTATYVIKPADVMNGSFTNTVTATLNGKTYTAQDTVRTVTAAPELKVAKYTDTLVGWKVGDVITYTVDVYNSGNVTVSNITLSDTLVTLNEEAFDLAPRDHKTITYTYTVTQADVDAGQIKNTVTATGKDPSGNDVTQTASLTVKTVDPQPAIELRKSANPSSGVKAGDTITFTIRIKNVGNVTLTDLDLSDELPGIVLDDLPVTSISPQDLSAVTVTGTYVVTQADVDAGQVYNKATITGYYNGTPYTGEGDVTVKTIDSEAELTVEKTANPTSGVAVGDTVTYTVVVTNSGNVTVSDITLDDTLVTLTGADAEAFDLAPEGTKTITYDYTVTQADVDAGVINNTATATGKDPKGNDISKVDTAKVTTVTANPSLNVTKTANPASGVAVGDTVTYTVVVTNNGNVTISDIVMSDTLVTLGTDVSNFDLAPNGSKSFTYTYTVTQDDVDAGEIKNTVTATGKDPQNNEVTKNANATVTTVSAAASLSVDKTASPATGVAVGDTVTYTVVVTNTGNVTVSGIKLTDPKMAAADVPAAFTLAPGGAKTITYTYTVTQADVDAGKIDNTATATGKDPKNNDVTASDDATVTTVAAKPEIAIDKTADPTSGVAVGDTVTYTVVVTNTGNVTLSEIELADTLVPPTGEDAEAFTLAPEGTKTFTYTYTVTQADVDAGQIQNVASVTGKDPSGTEVYAKDNAIVTTVEADAKLTVNKTAEPAEGVAVGDTVVYTVVVTNTGNVTVTGIKLADTLVTPTGTNAEAFDLAPGGTNTFTYNYTVTQADVDAGKIENTATATGKDPKNNDVTASDDATVTTVAKNAQLTLNKTANPASGVAVGDVITYTATFKNTGNVTVHDISAGDSLVNLRPELLPDFFDLEPGETRTVTYTYTVTQADVDAGKIDNTVSAAGEDPQGNQVADSASCTVTTVEADAELTVVKTASKTEGLVAGETIRYTITTTNTGNVTIRNLIWNDSLVDVDFEEKNLAPGESCEVSYPYTITQEDVDRGYVENVATVGGQKPDDEWIHGTDDETVTTVAADAALTVEKTAEPTSGVEVGDTVTYTVVVTNTGNVTVSGITLEDALMAEGDAPEAFTLAPALKDEDENITNPNDITKTFTYTYTVTQADVDAGKIDNTATATGKDPKNNDVTDSDTATVTTVTAAPALTVEKTADPTSGVKVGDTVTYTVVVTNTGNVTVTGIKVSDPKMAAADVPAAFDLAPEGTKTITYTYTVTQADVDAGKIDNTATATGKDPKNNDVTASDDATVTTVAAEPGIDVEKTADPTEGVEDGDVINYTVVVTNTGNVTITGILFGDELVRPTGDDALPFDLAPAGTKTFTYTYTVTQGDVDRGVIHNVALAKGKVPGGTVADQDEEDVTTVTAAPALTVEKTADPTSGVEVGDTVTYTVVVTNSGNVTVKGITLEDALMAEADVPAAFDLAPGEDNTITYTYTVTQADVDAGKIVNTAAATGKDPKGNEVTDDDTATVTTVGADAALTVTKTASPTSGVKKDDTVTYTVTVTNSGNVTVTGITLSDTLVTLTGENAEAFDLAPNGTKTITYTYTVTQADVDAGKIDNTVTATGKDPKNEDVTNTASATVTTVDSEAELTVTKTADPTSGVKVGDTVTYTVVVTNTGNVTVSEITLADPLMAQADVPAAFGLAPGEDKEITYTYTVTQADVDAGSIVNTVTATGKDPKGNEISKPATATVTTVEAEPGISVEKTASPASNVKVGDTVTYTVVVTNTGNVTVTGIKLADTLVTPAGENAQAFDLAPAETKTLTYTYTVTQADVDAGSIQNVASATGKDPAGKDVYAKDDAIVTTVAAEPALTVEKTADPTSGVAVGAVVTYTVVVTNTGNVTVTGITLADTLVTLTGADAEAFDLAPEETKTITYEYTVTQADVDAGKIDNTATATGKDPKGNEVSDSDDATVTTETANAAITVEKTASPTSRVEAGDTVTYTVVVTNSGNVTVTGITLDDTLVTLTGENAEAFDLAPEGTKTITYTYTVTQADVDAGKIDNTATATGKDPKGNDVTDDDDATVTTVAADAVLTVDKTASPASGVKVGDTVTYTVVVTNSGNVTVTGITLDDTLVTLTGENAEAFDLAPDGTKTITYTYTVTQADVDAGKIDNTATATGKDPKGKDATDDDDATVTTVAAAPALTVEKTADPASGVEVGDTVTYTVVVTNTGNVTVTGIKLADTLVTPAGADAEAFDLAPEGTKTFTYTYTVTQADVDAGKIENTATATGKDPKGGEVTDDDDATVTTVTAAPALTVEKTASPTSGVKVGDTVTYTVVVTNTGNVTVTAIDIDDTLVPQDDGVFDLAPGESDTSSYTYTVTQADIDAGVINNTATATGKDPKGNNVTAEDSAEVTTEAAAAEISVTKTASPTSGVGVGDTVTYTVVVTNTGNVSVENGTLADDHADLSDKTFSLAPGESTEAITYTYTVTQADVDAGSIVNTVKANADAVRGDDPEEATASATVTTETAGAELSVTKSASPTSGVGVGDTVTYTVVVTNTGNVSVENGTLEDDHADLSDKTFDLAPGESTEAITYTYTVTQADVDAGSIVNTVKANADAVRGDDPEEATASATVTTENAEAELSITKGASPASGVKAGDTVTYTVVVTNTGNVSVTDGELDDDHADLSDKTFDLAPGENAEFTYTYTVTQADVDAGSIVNVVTANATAARGNDPEEVEATATVTTEAAEAELSITKTASPTSNVKVGDTVTYTVVVTNTGNVSVTDGVLDDDHADLSNKTFNLAPGENAEFTYTYTVTQADVDAGSIVNTVTANATAARGEDPEEVEASATVTTEAPSAELSITKEIQGQKQNLAVGDVITYKVVVTNTGNVSVTDGILDDDHADLSAETFELAPGESAEFTYTYTVTQEDYDAGQIVNTVTANATAVRGEDPEEVEASATAECDDEGAALNITKTASPTSGVKAGDTVTYTVVVTNVGKVSVKDGILEDDHADLSDKTFELAPGENATFTYTYTVLQSDIDAGSIVNVVTANATAVRGDDPDEVEATATVTAEAAEAELSITKTASPTSGVKVGDTVTYTVVVTNTGNVSVTDGELEDDHADLSDKTFALAPGEKATFTYTYTVLQSDIDAGSIVNVVTANATAARGDDPDEVTATATVTTEAAEAELSITKTASPTSGLAVGSTVTYTVTVTNTGNVSVKDGVLDDDHADLSNKTFALAPGEKAEFTYTYTVTQADVDAGSIVNVVTANATAVRGEDPEEVEATATVTTEAAKAELSITKTASPTSGVAVGDTVTYTVTVTNTGNVTVKDGVLEDDHADLSDKTFNLAPGGAATITYTYTVTQADVDAGSIVNVVTANATAVRGDDPEEVEATATVTTEAAKAELSITKTASPTSGVAVGDTVTYTVTVTNTGNVTVKAGRLVDDHADLSGKTFTLAPGGKATFTYTYTVKQADVDAGSIVNVVTANATAVRGEDPEEVTATATVTTEAAAAALSITKTASPTENVAVGDTVTYTVVVTNTGNVSVKDGVLEDDHADLSDKTFALAPNEKAEFTYTYTVTQADVDAGSIVNIVTANATAVRGDDPEEVEATATVTAEEAAAALSITKTASPTSGVKKDDTVTYTVTVTNTGNVSVKDGVLEDDHTDLSDKTFNLAPGEKATFTYTYTVTQADYDAGQIVNVVTANATAVRGEDPEEVEATATVTAAAPNPGLSIEKTCLRQEGDVPAGDTLTYSVTYTNTGDVTLNDITLTDDHGTPTNYTTTLAPGESATITYTYVVTEADDAAGTVTNTVTAEATPARGTVDPATDSATTIVGTNDVFAKADPDDPDETMDVEAQSITVMYDGHEHTVDAEATREGSTIEYSTDGGDTWSEDAPVRTEAGETEFDVRALNDDYETVVKTGYTLIVTKRPITFTSASDEKQYDGTPLTNDEVTISGEGLADTDTVTFDVTGSQTLVGESDNTFTYRFDKKDGAQPAPGLIGLLQRIGIMEAPEPVDGETDVDTVAQNYEITKIEGILKVTEPEDDSQVINKTHTDEAGNTQTYQVGDTIEFTITVTNIYDEEKTITIVEQEGVTITGESVFEGVQPGETVQTTATYTVTEEDALNGTFTNTATALFDGETPYNGTDTVDSFAHMTVTKKVTNSPADGKMFRNGETIKYEVTVLNDGTMTLTDVVVTDELTGDKWTVASLEPGQKKTFKAEYVPTAADAEKGSVTNVAIGEGKDTDGEKITSNEAKVTTDVGKAQSNGKPKTGDETQLMSYMFMLTTALFGILLLFRRRKEER